MVRSVGADVKGMSEANREPPRAALPAGADARPAARPGPETAAASRPGAADELQLVRRCVEGDEAAWDRFLSRYGPLIHHVIRRVLARYGAAGSAEEEDVFASIMEVLLRDQCRALRSFREPYNLSAWLSVLVRRQGRAYLESRRTPEVSLAEPELLGKGAPVLDAVVDREAASRLKSQARALHDVLDELPPRDRLIVRLFYFDRRKYREIARIVRMPMGNVGKTLARAIEKLRAKLDDAGIGLD